MYSYILYLAVAAGTLYLIRMLPLSLIRKDIKNKYIRSFLYYVPFVTLAVMTVPAIFYATGSIISGIAGFATGLILAFFDGNLFRVALGSCLAVLLTEWILSLAGYL
ncbi:MAG: AzlD domain-containing protein [Lachnospiraceae bacterium]|jgi:branched-subunit amino acid transport protein|nr:AzlD domain-containing protein [Lachnospiraceae bacterium]